MPFTAPLLSVVGEQFDVLIEDTNGRPNPAGGSSNAYRWSNDASGTWNVIGSDPKSIVQRVTDHGNGDGIALTNSGTLKLTVISQPTYSSSNSGDQAGFQTANLDSTSTTSPPDGTLNSFAHVTFASGSNNTIEAVTIDNAGTRPALYFGLKRALGSSAFNISGRLLIGINKT
jgi:hypothetical protein